MLGSLLVLLSLVLQSSPPALPPIDLQPETLIAQRVKRYGGSDIKREAALKQMFGEAGCAEITEQPVKGLKEPNLICVMKGNSERSIIVGAHYDHVDRGSGVVDNWSGASLLPSLMQSLKNEQRRHTYIFIAFPARSRARLARIFTCRASRPPTPPKYRPW